MLLIGLRVYYQNMRGLRTKLEDCFEAVSDNVYEVVAVSETWIGELHSDCDLFIGDYIVFRANRKYLPGIVEHGGGVLLAVRRSIKVVRRYDLELTNEYVWVEIRQKVRSPL